jgi:hypothetical protein
MALKLAARESTLATIAEQTRTSRTTIRKWLAAAKKRSKGTSTANADIL